ncbi:MAG: hypothetical protein RLN80_03635, partial [Rhodospirillales bacterium]
FATGFSERAVEHFQAAAVPAQSSPVETARIEQLETRLAQVETELAALKASKTKTPRRRQSGKKPVKKKSQTNAPD